MSTSNVIGSMQSALNCAGKCDCCEKLQLQINALKSDLQNYIPQSDRPMIIKSSVAAAENLIVPLIGTAILSQLGPVKAAVAALEAALAVLSARIAVVAGTATGAASTAGAALSKVASLATALFALAASVGTLLVLGERIDALEGQVDSVANGLSKALSLLLPIKSTAERALGIANSAQSIGQRAQSTADKAIGVGQTAQSTADRAIGVGQAAQSTADRAIGVGQAAQSTADKAIGMGQAAQSTADKAIGIGQTAQSTADKAIGIGQTAQSTADKAFNTAEEALKTAQNALTRVLIPGATGARGLTGATGIKDAEGSPLDIATILGSQFDSLAKTVIGESEWGSIKAEYKKWNRIYQAAANLMNSIQSIGYSILSAVEVVGSWVASIGNALRKWGEVGESAYRWMNPTPNFQNKFFTALETTENVVSQIDSVASEVLSVQQTVTQIGQQKDELSKTLQQDDNSKQGTIPPEATKVRGANQEAKQKSTTPEIPAISSEADKEADE